VAGPAPSGVFSLSPAAPLSEVDPAAGIFRVDARVRVVDAAAVVVGVFAPEREGARGATG
jgi:hypothetical protein